MALSHEQSVYISPEQIAAAQKVLRARLADAVLRSLDNGLTAERLRPRSKRNSASSDSRQS